MAILKAPREPDELEFAVGTLGSVGRLVLDVQRDGMPVGALDLSHPATVKNLVDALLRNEHTRGYITADPEPEAADQAAVVQRLDRLVELAELAEARAKATERRAARELRFGGTIPRPPDSTVTPGMAQPREGGV